MCKPYAITVTGLNDGWSVDWKDAEWKSHIRRSKGHTGEAGRAISGGQLLFKESWESMFSEEV